MDHSGAEGVFFTVLENLLRKMVPPVWSAGGGGAWEEGVDERFRSGAMGGREAQMVPTQHSTAVQRRMSALTPIRDVSLWMMTFWGKR